MKPSRPTTVVWVIALIAGIAGIAGHFMSIQYISQYDYWLLLIGFVLLALGTTFKRI